MSENINVPRNRLPNPAAPTPQNTPLTSGSIQAPVLSRPAVPSIEEDEEDEDEDDDDGKAALLDPRLAPELMKMVQGRLASLVGKSSGYIEGLPYHVRRRVEGLKGVQVEYTALQAKFHQEMLELEKKYNSLAGPLYEKRLAIIQGEIEPTDAEVEAGIESSRKEEDEDIFDEEEAKKKADKEEDVKGIPEFWLTALRNHVGISDLITERDEAALRHLTNITLSYLASPAPGYKLTFHFSPNDFFTNETLEKTYHYKEEVSYLGDWMYDHAQGTDIQWKEDKDLTKAVEIKKQRNKNTNRTRLIRKVIPTDSFFNFFSPPVPPTEDMLEDDDVDQDEIEDIEERLELDYQIGEDIKDRIIPRAIDYFTGRALKYDAMEEGLDEEGYEDEDDDGFEDEDDEDDEGGIPAAHRGPKDANKADECKNQ